MAGLRIVAEGRVSVVTVNRPDVLNALDTALLEELLATLEDLGSDPTCGVIVVTGAGDRAFIAGADIKRMHPRYTMLLVPTRVTTRRRPSILGARTLALSTDGSADLVSFRDWQTRMRRGWRPEGSARIRVSVICLGQRCGGGGYPGRSDRCRLSGRFMKVRHAAAAAAAAQASA